MVVWYVHWLVWGLGFLRLRFKSVLRSHVDKKVWRPKSCCHGVVPVVGCVCLFWSHGEFIGGVWVLVRQVNVSISVLKIRFHMSVWDPKLCFRGVVCVIGCVCVCCVCYGRFSCWAWVRDPKVYASLLFRVSHFTRRFEIPNSIVMGGMCRGVRVCVRVCVVDMSGPFVGLGFGTHKVTIQCWLLIPIWHVGL